MDQQNQGSGSSITNKRKRGRPRRDEGQTQQQVTTTIDENLIGQAVSGVVEGSFEAGYFLNVKVADTDKQLKGIVFLPDKVNPVTPTTDLFPQAKMYAREDIPIPPQGKKDNGDQTDDIGPVSQAEKNQAAMLHDDHPMSDSDDSPEAIDERNDSMDTEMKLTEHEGQTLSLMPQFASDDATRDDHTLLRTESEACAESKKAVTVTVTTTSLKDSIAEGCTTLVDFFPATETNRMQAMGTSSTLSLELFQNETKRSGTEDEKSSASPVDDDVPEELQLELGNKKMSASAISTEANLDHSAASSKGGFLANFFEGREDTAKEAEESNLGLESGFTEATTQVDDNDS